MTQEALLIRSVTLSTRLFECFITVAKDGAFWGLNLDGFAKRTCALSYIYIAVVPAWNRRETQKDLPELSSPRGLARPSDGLDSHHTTYEDFGSDAGPER